jgi:hypothetical protein
MKRIITDLEGVLRGPLPLTTSSCSTQEGALRGSQEEGEGKGPSLTELACVSLRKVCTNLLLSPHTEATNGKTYSFRFFRLANPVGFSIHKITPLEIFVQTLGIARKLLLFNFKTGTFELIYMALPRG